jgi:cytochrome c553
MRYWSIAVILTLGSSAVLAQGIDAETAAAARQLAITVCASCHGRQGRSEQPKFPVLAGQHADYLLAQLQAFKAQTRGDPDALGYMWGMAGPLDDALMAGLADYYSKQTPKRGSSANAAILARGRQIYQDGDSAAGVPPCAACHGPEAHGTDMFPRLAGQHAQYLVKQLRSFRNNLRNVAIMHGVAQGLQLGDMRAAATYLDSMQ